MEIEGVDANGIQEAALVWSRGADAMSSMAPVSDIGDAYDLAETFGRDFSDLLVTGRSPFGGIPALPSRQQMASAVGMGTDLPICETFGGPTGLGTVGELVGLPPEWVEGAKDGHAAPPP